MLSLLFHISLFCFVCFQKQFIDGLFDSVDNAEKFLEASKKGNVIPLYRSIFSDHLTPVLAYRCLVKEDERDAPSFLFESVEPGLQLSSIVSNFILSSFFPFFFGRFLCERTHVRVGVLFVCIRDGTVWWELSRVWKLWQKRIRLL